MTDITDRLRVLDACDPGCHGRCAECPNEVARDAIRELERLRRGLDDARDMMRGVARQLTEASK